MSRSNKFIHPYQVRGQRPPGRRCGANGPRGENVGSLIWGNLFVRSFLFMISRVPRLRRCYIRVFRQE